MTKSKLGTTIPMTTYTTRIPTGLAETLSKLRARCKDHPGTKLLDREAVEAALRRYCIQVESELDGLDSKAPKVTVVDGQNRIKTDAPTMPPIPVPSVFS